ncbi:MAG: EpsI family protein [Thermodesulfobacteriota bacterium]|nr:EpsI family protein [Thermodesulfobacteriota bacterium]
MSWKQTLIASSIMILAMVGLSYLSHRENICPNRPLSTFPRQIGEWVGKEERFDHIVYEKLGVDDSFLCKYSMSDGNQIELYIGFYQSQHEGDLIHSPKNCMPGSGWAINHVSLEEIVIPNNDPGRVEVVKLILEKGAYKQVVIYWFQSRGRFISSEYMQKIYLVIDSIMRHRTDGSFVRLIGPVIDNNEAKTTKNIKDFAKLIIPKLQEYIPS